MTTKKMNEICKYKKNRKNIKFWSKLSGENHNDFEAKQKKQSFFSWLFGRNNHLEKRKRQIK